MAGIRRRVADRAVTTMQGGVAPSTLSDSGSQSFAIAQGAGTLGYASIVNAGPRALDDYTQGSDAVLSSGATGITGGFIYLDGNGSAGSGSQQVHVGVYDNASTMPNHLLAQSADITVNFGDAPSWRAITFPSFDLPAGTYWLMVQGSTPLRVAQFWRISGTGSTNWAYDNSSLYPTLENPFTGTPDVGYTVAAYLSIPAEVIKDAGTATLSGTPSAAEQIIEPPVVTFAHVMDDFNTGPSQALTSRTAAGWDAGGWPGAASLQTDSGPSYALGSAAIYTANISAASFLDAETFAVFAVPAGETYIMVRWTDGSNYYYVNTVVAAYLRLAKVVAGVDTSLAETAQTISAGDSVGISVVGSRLSSWYKPSGGSWRVVDSVIDTSLAAAGRLAIETYTTTAHIDAFGGGVAGTFAVAPSATETLSDSGTCTFAVVPSGAETLADAGSTPLVVVATPAESISDVGTCTFVLSQTASESLTGGSLSDAGTCTFVLAESATETLRDVGSIAFVLLPLMATEGPSDAGSISVTLPETASETYSDTGSQNVVLAPTSAQTLADAATCTLSVTPTSAETISDATSTTFVLAPTYDFIWPDSGSCTFVVLPTAAEQFQDSATTIFVLTEADSERESDQGTVPVILTPSGVESIVDFGSQSAVITPSTTETPADAGTQPGVLSQSAAETYIESGSVFVTITPSETGIEQGVVTVVLAPSATQTISDAGTATVGITPSAAEQLQDTGFDYLAIARGDLFGPDDLVYPDDVAGPDYVHGFEAFIDGGASSVVVTPTSTELISDGGSTFVTITPFQQGIEQGIVTIALGSTATESIFDAGTATMVLAPSAPQTISDAAAVTVGIVPTAAQTISDASTSFSGIVSNAENTTVLDSFNAGALQALTARAGWNAGAIWTGDTSLQTDAVPTKASGVGTWNDNYWDTPYADGDFTVTFAGTLSNYFDIYARLTAVGSPTGYALGINAVTGNWFLGKYVAGVYTDFPSIGTRFSKFPGAGDQARLVLQGQQLSAYFKPSGGTWQLVASASDAAITGSGYWGVDVGGTASPIDTWVGGAIGAPLASETLTDSGTCSLVLTPSAGANDTGTITIGVASGGNETLVDSGSTFVVIIPVQPGITDSGTATIGIAPAAGVTISESALERVLFQWGSLYPGDLVYPGDVAGPGYVHGYEALIEGGTVVMTFPPYVSTPTDAGSAIVGITSSATEVILDAGTCSLTLAPSAADMQAQLSTVTLVLAPSRAETVGDVGAVTLVFPAVQSVNAGTCTFGVDGTAAETITADATIAVQTVVLTPSYFGGTPGSLGGQALVLSQTAVETIVGDPSAATCTIMMLPSHTWTAGFDASPLPPPLSGGDAADRRRHRDALARVRARRAGDPEHRDRKLVRR